MRPHIICHMLATIDGRIDGAALRAFVKDTEYEETGAQLGGDAWVCGRVTMQQHFAEEGLFESKSNNPAGHDLIGPLSDPDLNVTWLPEIL